MEIVNSRFIILSLSLFINFSHVTVSSADYQPVVLQNSAMRSLRDDLAILSSASSEFQLLLEENPNLLQALTVRNF